MSGRPPIDANWHLWMGVNHAAFNVANAFGPFLAGLAITAGLVIRALALANERRAM